MTRLPRNTRYRRSEELLERAQRVIPLGSQTFSKSHIQYPAGYSPLFLTKGSGAHVTDVDGHDYVDLVCGLLPVVLGYCDPDVDAAVRAQLECGMTFSLATELEIELAELLVDIIPCAEMVRFGKNGSDATSACVRLARAATGRDRLAVTGYHGWQDWYVGATTRNKGVPDAVGALTSRFSLFDIDGLHKILNSHPGEFAAVMIEAIAATPPTRDHLAEIAELTRKHGALLIFDEVVTGFRVALGGAQAHYDVVPDLAAFGKSMGNGLPISAVVGRASLMKEMEEIFYSGTFGGEALSLAGTIACVKKMRRENTIEALWKKGAVLRDGLQKKIDAHGLAHVFTLGGVPSWVLLGFKDAPGTIKEAIKTFVMKEMLAEGVLVASSHNVCSALSDADIATVLAAYDRTLARLADELRRGDLEARLDCPVIRPVFAVR